MQFLFVITSNKFADEKNTFSSSFSRERLKLRLYVVYFFIHLPNFRNDQQITAIFYRLYPITSAVLSYFSLNCSDALGMELCTVSNGYPILSPEIPRKILYKSSFLLQELSRRCLYPPLMPILSF